MLPVRLNTKPGLEQFTILHEQYVNYNKQNQGLDFKMRCKADLEMQNKYLEYFLDDETLSRKYKMDEADTEGFRIFNEQSDVVTCLRYFAGVRDNELQHA